MSSVFGTLVGDQTISSVLDFFGQATGSLTVAAGGSLNLYGQVAGDVTVLAGGKAELQGQIGGSVENRGGSVRIGGMVIGDVATISGETVVSPTAIIVRQT